MRLFFLLLFTALVSAGCGDFSARAQIQASSNRTVSPTNGNQTNPDAKTDPRDITAFDFKNFTYPDFSGGKVEKTFTLKNGSAGRQTAPLNYVLRKTYYFDLTGDRQNEAISQVLVEGCAMECDSRSLFYIYTAEKNQPKLLWKIATGLAEAGGLKAIAFNRREIVLEAFGDCALDGWLVKPNPGIIKNPKLKTITYTRFVFSRAAGGYLLESRDVLPLGDTNITAHRPQIQFGEQ